LDGLDFKFHQRINQLFVKGSFNSILVSLYLLTMTLQICIIMDFQIGKSNLFFFHHIFVIKHFCQFFFFWNLVSYGHYSIMFQEKSILKKKNGKLIKLLIDYFVLHYLR